MAESVSLYQLALQLGVHRDSLHRICRRAGIVVYAAPRAREHYARSIDSDQVAALAQCVARRPRRPRRKQRRRGTAPCPHCGAMRQPGPDPGR